MHYSDNYNNLVESVSPSDLEMGREQSIMHMDFGRIEARLDGQTSFTFAQKGSENLVVRCSSDDEVVRLEHVQYDGLPKTSEEAYEVIVDAYSDT